MSKARWLLGGALLVATVIINPLYACRGGAPASFTFGTDEVQAAVEGAWTLVVPATSTEPARTVALQVEVSDKPARIAAAGSDGLVASAYACGSRTLVRSAGACLDVTRVPLTVTVASGDVTTARGSLEIYGLRFDRGQLMLQLDAQPLTATLSPGGQASDVRLGSAHDDAAWRDGTLVRAVP
jgi:hypothetical protein